MIIAKDRFDRSRRNVGKLYQQHVKGELSPSAFVTKARTELNALYIQHTRALIQATADLVIDELRSFQAQFGLDLNCDSVVSQVARGYRGIQASVYVRNKTHTYYHGSVDIFIGPFDEWDKIAVHTVEELEEGYRPSFYTQRRMKCSQKVQDFNFPDLLQRIKENVEKPEPEYGEEEFPF